MVGGGAVIGFWEPASHFFPTEKMDDFLVWAWREGASDVVFQVGAPALIEVDGRVRRGTNAVLDGVVLGEIAERLYEGSAVGSLLSGGAVDCSHAVSLERGRDIRFRCNLSPVPGEQQFRDQCDAAGASWQTRRRLRSWASRTRCRRRCSIASG